MQVEDAELFGPCETKGRALLRCGISNSLSMIKAKTALGKEAKSHVDQEIRRATGNRIKELKEIIGGRKLIQCKKFHMKYKHAWSRNIKTFKKNLNIWKDREVENKEIKETTK